MGWVDWDNTVYADFDDLVGKVLIKIIDTTDEIRFYVSEKEYYKLYHRQDCCESVFVESVTGDLQDLVGSAILLAEESTSNEYQEYQEKSDDPYYDESFTWTFYKLATIKGYVDIRWYGGSNGYYSESVDFFKVSE